MAQKIIVIGMSGSGKTTLARALAAKLNIKHIELDAHYHHANWQPNPNFITDSLQDVHSAESWVIDGNYGSKGTREHIWPLADTIVWLDYPKWLTLWRVTIRSVRRGISKEQLWHNNQESLHHFFSWTDQSLFRFVWTTYAKRRRQYSAAMQDSTLSHLNFIRQQSPRETQSWLDAL